MSKFEITIKADELIAAMIKLANALENNEGDTPNVPAKSPSRPPSPQQQNPQVTIEQIRAVLVAKSQAGKQLEVKELIKKYGAAKLTDVDPGKFVNMLADAESL